MSLIWLKRAAAGAAALAAALLLPTLLHAALPGSIDTHGRTSLAGQLLVASPAMRDPRFDHAVILMVQHSQEGALGIVINMPIDERPLASLMEMMGEKDDAATGQVRIFLGGPVQPEKGFVVHSSDYHRPETVTVDAQLAVTASRDILHDIAGDKGPKKALVALGYAGWGPGQLEGELERRVWFVAPADPALIFDAERNKVWDIAFAHRSQDL